jgi:hypothetical protein
MVVEPGWGGRDLEPEDAEQIGHELIRAARQAAARRDPLHNNRAV